MSFALCLYKLRYNKKYVCKNMPRPYRAKNKPKKLYLVDFTMVLLFITMQAKSNKKPPRKGGEFGFYIGNWIYSGDDRLFRGLSQSTIGDTGFPCLVRDGTEGGSRSIITRINPANIIIPKNHT